MADGTFSGQGQWPEEQKPKLDTGEGEVPLTVPPKIDVRTMASDKKSLDESGGISPRPYTPPPNMQTISPAQLTDTPKTDSTFQEPTKDIFKLPLVESTPVAAPMDLVKKPKSKKGLVNFIIVLIVIAGIGALSYFVIYPTFFQAPQIVMPSVCGNGVCETDENTTNCSSDCQVTPPAPPICGDGVCESDETGNNCALDCQTSPPGRISLFKIPTDLTINENENLPTPTPTFLIEIVADDPKNLLANFPNSVKNLFSDSEIAHFVYANQDNSYAHGFVYTLKTDVNLIDAQGVWMQYAEGAQNPLMTFLSIQAGEPTTWKNGQTGSVANRYLTFNNSNAAVNYGWLNNKLVVTGSYNAFKESTRRLQ